MLTIANQAPARILRTLLLIVLVTSVWGCKASLSPPPDQIIGRWSTDAPRHRDRIFEIRDEAVVFGTGISSGGRLHLLMGVEEMPETQGWQVYVLHYREYDGSIGQLEIHHVSASRDQLRFANRDEVWTRAATGEQDDA